MAEHHARTREFQKAQIGSNEGNLIESSVLVHKIIEFQADGVGGFLLNVYTKTIFTYRGFPSEDIGIEASVVFCNVEPALC